MLKVLEYLKWEWFYLYFFKNMSALADGNFYFPWLIACLFNSCKNEGEVET